MLIHPSEESILPSSPPSLDQKAYLSTYNFVLVILATLLLHRAGLCSRISQYVQYP